MPKNSKSRNACRTRRKRLERYSLFKPFAVRRHADGEENTKAKAIVTVLFVAMAVLTLTSPRLLPMTGYQISTAGMITGMATGTITGMTTAQAGGLLFMWVLALVFLVPIELMLRAKK